MKGLIERIRKDLGEVEKAKSGDVCVIPRDYGMLYLATLAGWEWPDYASQTVTSKDFNKAIKVLKGAMK